MGEVWSEGLGCLGLCSASAARLGCRIVAVHAAFRGAAVKLELECLLVLIVSMGWRGGLKGERPLAEFSTTA